jgi:hypothetical protein
MLIQSELYNIATARISKNRLTIMAKKVLIRTPNQNYLKKCVAYPQEDFLFTILHGDFLRPPKK